MKKIIKSGLFFVLAYLLISAVSLAADDAASDDNEMPAEPLVEEQSVAPTLKGLPPAPTIKDLAEKQLADDEVLKKLAEAPAIWSI